MSNKVWLNGLGRWDERVNKREQPSTSSMIVGTVNGAGELAIYIRSQPHSDGIWHNFQGQDGKYYWIRNDVISMVNLSSSDAISVKPITYHSQNDANSNLSPNDCGPACSVMMLSHGKITTTVNEFMRVAGINHTNYTSFAENMRGISRYGLTSTVRQGIHLSHILEYIINNKHPVFSLIYINPLRPNEYYSHFVVVSGYKLSGWNLQIEIQDPNIRDGHNKLYSANAFAEALGQKGSSSNYPWQSLFILDYPENNENDGNCDPDIIKKSIARLETIINEAKATQDELRRIL